MIEVDRLTKDFGTVVAVRDVSFSVKKGEIVGFLGPNGAGKSTTLRIIAGFLGATSGKVSVNGHDIAESALSAKKSLGYMPESAPLYSELRVVEYLRFRAALKGVARRERKKAAQRALELSGAADMAEVVIGHLSKGYRQRVALADALVNSPPLLILDEPTAGLDPNQILEVRKLIRELGREHTILLSTHILSEVEAVCQRALVIARGKLVAEGTLEELRRLRHAATMILVVRGVGELVQATLAGVQGVARTTLESADAGVCRVELELEQQGDPERAVESAVAALVAAGHGVRSVERKGRTLEEVFAEVTRVEPADRGAGAMSGLLAIFRREMLSLWVTPLAWVLLTVFLLLQGITFYSIVLHYSSMTDLAVESGPVQAYFGQDSILLLMTLLLVCPALTMRSFAEERRSGTIEALLTAPVTPSAVVLGKYLAVLATYALMWAPTVLYVLILRKTGVVDWAAVGTSYLGLLGVGAAYLALGLLMSALSKSQLVALLLTVGALFGLFILGIGEYIFEPGLLQELSAHVSMASQMEEFSRGLIDLRRVVFDLSLAVTSLFVTVRVVDAWRWS